MVFVSQLNFHYGCSTLDGKHMAIKCPKKSGSMYYNYKGFFLNILLDTDYKFLWAHVVANGSASDSILCSTIGHKHTWSQSIENLISFLDTKPLPNNNHDIPYFFISDDAFSLHLWLMNLYSLVPTWNWNRMFSAADACILRMLWRMPSAFFCTTSVVC